MQGHRRRRETQRSPATPISPKGGGGAASISLSLLLRDAHRHRVVVALATNVTVFVERDTKDKMTIFLENQVPLSMMDATSFIRSLCGEGTK